MLCVMRILKTCTYHHVIHSRFLVMAERSILPFCFDESCVIGMFDA